MAALILVAASPALAPRCCLRAVGEVLPQRPVSTATRRTLPPWLAQDEGKYEETSGAVRTLVSSLTSLVNAVAGTPPPLPDDTGGEPILPTDLRRGVEADYVERLYLWTGDIDASLYDAGARFTDPTLSFTGLATFQRNMAALRPILNALVRQPTIDLFSCELDEDANQVRAAWRMAADLALPWRPAIDLRGRTTFTYEPSRGGKIVDYREEWESNAGETLLQLVRPGGAARRGDERGDEQGRG